MDYDYSDDDEQMEDDLDVSGRQKTFKTLKEEDIKQLQEDNISDVINVLSVSRSVACTLLCQNQWVPSSAYEKWCERPVVSNSEKQAESICKICFDTPDTAVSAACGHPFCAGCFARYISVSIEGGPGCLELKCPEPGCEAHPGLDMVDSLSSPGDKQKYYKYLYRSYVELSPNKRKWCPAPGCNLAIEFDGCPDEGFDVACDCKYKFCWRCGDDIHSPLDCDTVKEWMKKNATEAENTTWILAYTKPCPKCRRPIEKNQGCHHMRCGAPCRTRFCWLCLQPLSHPNGPCNKYREGGRKLAKEHLERYTHYYERWDTNDKSRKMALASLGTAKNEHIERLTETHGTHGQTYSQLEFVIQAWEQIVECRRVLKWSYAYGYYRLSSLSGRARVKLELFEHSQWQAESALERLHHCAENEMKEYLLADGPCKDFNEFRQKLVTLTAVTKKYFEDLVRALQNNLSEVKVVNEVKVIVKNEEAFIYADEEAHIAEAYYTYIKSQQQ